jgi:prepilin-type N-terminal cleavage/methylation domain-containing protein
MQRERGFTMVEILVVMAIIVVLIGLLVVAAGGARQAAMASTTSARLTALSQAATRFEADAGYLPPLLDNDRAGISGLEPTRKVRASGYPDYLATAQRRYSYTSAADYLLGYGTEAEDGVDGLGARRPGADGFWDASWNDGMNALQGVQDGRFELRERKPVRHGQQGTVLGPYLELDDPSMLGALGWDLVDDNDPAGVGQWDGSIDPATNQPVVYFPGDPGYSPDAPKVIVDAWGTPIRYYRINHPPGQPAVEYPANYEPVGGDGWRYSPSLSEYFALRPYEIGDGESVISWFDDGTTKWGDFSATASASTSGDPTSTRTLMDGRFAFVSAGPNRRIYDWARVDFPGEAIAGLSDARGDHAASDPLADGWYEDGKNLPWLGRPAYNAGVIGTEEANRDNIVEVGT